MSRMPSSDLAKFNEEFKKSKHILVLTGAGISAESGIPTFRGAGGLWRTFKSQDLATPEAFQRNPSLVWEFYHYRREVVLSKQPNPAHLAIASAQQQLRGDGKDLIVVTQNIDELHSRAGATDVVELHGSLFKTRCTKCHEVLVNRDSPICPSLEGKGCPDVNSRDAEIPVDALPRCKKCSGLLRPHVTWFGEGLDEFVLNTADYELEKCDLCVVVGTSSIVYPAAMFAPRVAARGVTVAEFNIEETPVTDRLGYFFKGPCGEMLPKALAL